jgi:Na+/H+ antiporter NhaD/arsenite permease-like protein
MQRVRIAFLVFIAITLPEAAHAAALDGATLRWPWALPFVGMVLTIALAPQLFPRLWNRHYAKLAFVWGTLAIVPIAALYEVSTAVEAFTRTFIGSYIHLIVLLFTLYVVAGGIYVTGEPRGTPVVNTAFLAIGMLLANVVGTAGAALLLIRPLLRANASRQHSAHVVVFFIILVANVGGALSPLGDAALFTGFLRGVDFFWPAQHLWLPITALAAGVLALFLIVDIWLYRKDRRITVVGEPTPPVTPLRLHGAINLLLLAAVIATIMIAARWQTAIAFDIATAKVTLPELVRDAALLVIALLSLLLTRNEHRESNGFAWDPIREVAILFAGIFACLVPVLAMLQAGQGGAFGWLPAFVDGGTVPREIGYFWLTGLVSAFLDNALTYSLFFDLAGGDAKALAGPLSSTLAAISLGAVIMGALTYVGNAPNLLIAAMARERGVRMPSFIGYLFWAALILLPGLLLLTFVFLVP